MSEKRFDFMRLDPSDGFRIIRVSNEVELSLHLGLDFRGDLVGLPCLDGTVELAGWDNPDRVAVGAANRLQPVLEAVARYFTTGGDLYDLLAALSPLSDLPRCAYPGWHYNSGELVYDHETCCNRWEHVFVADVDQGPVTPAVVWLEGMFFDEKTLGLVVEERRQNNEDAERRAAGQGGELELPDHQDTEGPQLPRLGHSRGV